MVQNVFTIFMAVITVTTATGVGVYWFFNSLLSLLQSYIVHVIILKRRESGSGARSKLSKLGL
jgi:YidC/Oxa1 family membrane protein insertase